MNFMSENLDPLPLLKAKLDELERVVRVRFEPRTVERQATLANAAPVRELPVQEPSRDTPGALMSFIARLFGSKR